MPPNALNSSSPIQFVFFDVTGTLLHVPRGVAAHYREVAARHGFDVDERRLGKSFKAAFDTTAPPASTHTARPDDDRGWWRTLVDKVLDECGAPAAFPREPYFEDLYLEFARPGVWEPYPEVREVLESLAPQFTLGIITNFDGRIRTVLEQLDLARHFRVLAISSEVGADKPDPWIFQQALQFAGAEPQQTLYVGDDPACDWAGGAAAGLQVFELERPRLTLRELAAQLLPR